MTRSVRRLARRSVQAAKRKMVMRLGFVSDQKFYLDSGMTQPRADVERIQMYSDAVDVEFILPVDGTKTRNVYRPRYVYGLSDATVDPLSGLVYDANGQFIAESSSWLALRQFYSWPQPEIKSPARRLQGEFIFLPGNGYYHWLIEDLPVFLNSLLLVPQARVLMPTDAASYVREAAELSGKEIVLIDAPVRVERLVMTAKTGGLGSPLAGLTPHPADVATLRSFFAKYLTQRPCNRRLYLSRTNQTRSPANESSLQLAMEKQGFEIFDGTKMSLSVQIALFSSASHLIGIHGASLSNIVWAPDRVRVCELFSSDYMPSCYSALTSMRSGHYTPVLYTPDAANGIDEATMTQLTRMAEEIGEIP